MRKRAEGRREEVGAWEVDYGFEIQVNYKAIQMTHVITAAILHICNLHPLTLYNYIYIHALKEAYNKTKKDNLIQKIHIPLYLVWKVLKKKKSFLYLISSKPNIT